MTKENQNLLLAIGLSILVLIGWNYFYGQPKLDQARQQQAQTQTPDGSAVPALPVNPGAPPASSAPPAAGTVAPPAPTQRIAIDTPALKGSIALTGARIDDVQLKGYRQTIEPGSPNIVLFSPLGSANPYFAELGFVQADGAAVPARDAVWTADQQTLTQSQPVTLTHEAANGLVFRRVISVDDRFMFTVKDSVENRSGNAVSLSPYALVQRHGMPHLEGYIVLHEGFVGVIGEAGLQEYGYDKIDKEARQSKSWKGTGGWVGITDKYWASAIAPDQSMVFDGRYSSFPSNVTSGARAYQSDVTGEARALAPGATLDITTRVFAGAKEVSTVDAYQDQGILKFSNLIDWGYFYFFTQPLFQLIHFIYSIVGNFGVAILVVTLLIKLVFFPLANRSYASMAKMKAVQPEMTAIRERYTDDKQKQQQELMALYKREKINPVAGCLPILIQIPVFFALYKVIFITIEMRHAPFFGWIKDLSAHDPTNIFTLFGLIPWNPGAIPLFGPFLLLGIWPILMGITMFVQMKMNPEPTDPVQKTMFTWMPVLFTFMLGAFPAGLVIYWTWNNLLSVLQQGYIMRKQGVKIELWDNLANLFRKKAPAAK